MKRRNRGKRPTPVEPQGRAAAKIEALGPGAGIPAPPRGVAAACWICAAVAFAWAYWPTLESLVSAWNRQPDYSHGYFVAPLAVYFLWMKRAKRPGAGGGFAWVGVLLILASVGVRFLAARFYIEALDGWSILIWLAGAVCLAGGWRLLAWAWPSVAFLFFMIPLPWNAERLFSLPLQRIATAASSWVLQCLGQPAIAEGNTIWIGSQQLEIERACSGLRIFVAVTALAFAYLMLFERPWWKRGLLLLSVGPIAILANVIRIVATGLFGQYVASESVRAWAHDVLGWIMIPMGAAFFALVLVYLDRLVREVRTLDVGSIVAKAGPWAVSDGGEVPATGVLDHHACE